MRWLFLIFCFVLVFCNSASSGDDSEGQYIFQISTLPDEGEVFVGNPLDMPINKSFLFSIVPSKNSNGEIVVPENIPAALREMKKMLPPWYLNALLHNKTDGVCDVVVNDIPYSFMDWIWVNWNLNSSQSYLRQEFVELGVDEGPERMLIYNAIELGFCEYMRSNDIDLAIKKISEYGFPKIDVVDH